MALQTFALGKAAHQPVQDVLFLSGQCRGVCGGHGRKIAIQQRVNRAVVVHCARRKVDVVQKVSPLHGKVRVAGNDLCLQFQHHNGHSLVHTGSGGQIAGRCTRVGVGRPARHVGIGIGVLGEPFKPAQADAVAAFQRVKVVVRQRRFQHCHNAKRASGGGTHPDNIVVAPLNVHLMM